MTRSSWIPTHQNGPLTIAAETADHVAVRPVARYRCGVPPPRAQPVPPDTPSDSDGEDIPTPSADRDYDYSRSDTQEQA